MTTLANPIPTPALSTASPDTLRARILKSRRITIAGGIVVLIFLASVCTLFATASDSSRLGYNNQYALTPRIAPQSTEPAAWWGTDSLGRSMLGRCLMGGAASLAIGLAAAAISVALGVTVGLFAGYRGGWVDSILMRIVDILYGLPYLLLVILFKIAIEAPIARVLSGSTANFVVLFLAIGAVSWLTMARVVRGQVLSLRAQPFIEACKAMGLTEWRIFTRHLLPNLIGPITVYTTLVVPSAILQESFLSFLGIGIQPPVPTWGSLAAEGMLPALNPVQHLWWLLFIPCLMLAVTLLSLNFVGDGLRDVFDPKRETAKI